MHVTLKTACMAAAISALAPPQALAACTPSSLVWSAQGVGVKGLSQSYTASDGSAVPVSIDDPSGAVGGLLPPTPAVLSYYQGGYGTAPTPLNLNPSYAQLIVGARLATLNAGAPASTVTTSFQLGVPGLGVEQLQFNLFDVDGETSARFLRQERYVVRGSLNGVAVAPSLAATSNMTAYGADTVTGTQPVNPSAPPPAGSLAPALGVLGVQFSQPVDRVEVVFSVDNQANPIVASSFPGFGFDNLSFCVRAATAPVEAVPTLSTWSAAGLPVALGLLTWWRQRRRGTA